MCDEVVVVMVEKGFVLYMWSENGFCDFGIKGKFIKMLGDMKGMKMWL